MKLGIGVPRDLFSSDPKSLVYYLESAEEIGYDFLSVGDHVLGADRGARPDWRPYFGKPALHDYDDVFHEPMVLFGYLAALTTRLELTTGILILPQRQTALLAKQAAEVDHLTGGRLRLVAATGWNDVEYEALGVDFKDRGARIEEQVALLRALWTQKIVTFKGRFHTVTAAGINPLPVQRPIPIWFGGHSEPVLRRVGEIGDGWFPWYPFFHEETIRRDLERIHEYARLVGRDPATVGFQGATYFLDPRFEPQEGDRRVPASTVEEGVAEAHMFRGLGATHYSVSALGQPNGIDEMLKALQRFKEMLGPEF